MVRTYNEYLKLLEAAVVGNGKRSLSDYQIEQFIKSNHLDSDWHIVLSEVKKDMAPIVKKYELQKTPITVKPVPSVSHSSSSNKAKKVKGYNEYLILLENAIVQNGKRELQASQIDDFIKINSLNADWGIVSSEVKKDMATILKKYQNPVRNVPKPSTPTRKPGGGYNSGRNNSSVGKQVKSYDVYMRLLEDAMLKNSKAELSDAQIYQFLSANKLDSDWGITSVEIRKDMKTISAKFARQERTEALRQKHSTAAAEPKSVNTASNAHRNEKKKSGLTEEDKNMVVLLRDMLKDYPDIVEDRRRLKSAIADILPGKKKEVNLLGTLVEENIIQAIRNKNSLDQVLCDRFASILEENYGTSMELARRMVLVWFHAYGRLILNKIVD